MKKQKESMPIKAYFKRAIRTDGELVAVRVVQAGQEINLTAKQALSLAAQLNERIAEHGI